MGLFFLAAAALPSLWFFANLGSSKKFHISVLTVLTLVLACIGAYVGFSPKIRSNPKAPPMTSHAIPRLPAVNFDDPEAVAVSWCKTYNLTTTGTIPDGYTLAIFAAGTGPSWDVSDGYTWIGNAAPVDGQHNQWVTPLTYIGPKTANSGFLGVVVAEILPAQVSGILSAISPRYAQSGAPAWGVEKLPTDVPAATERIIRNGETSGC